MRELLPVPMQDTMGDDVYSGIARAAGLLWCGRERADAGAGNSDTVFVFFHPSSNFVNHYALTTVAGLGVDAVGMVTRYTGNDTQVILENCLVDIGSVIHHLREVEGYSKVVLVGNSGGGGPAAFYQSQAEKPTVRDAPGGGGADLTKATLPPADALILLNAHSGRATLLSEWLDPAIVDENDPFRRDPELDIFAQQGTPFDRGWLREYRAAQLARMERITAWARLQQKEIDDRLDGLVPDLAFTVHGTCADPRFFDMTLDPSDRQPGTLWGDPLSANLRPTTPGSTTTLRSWLSQWSITDSNGYGADCLRHVSVPVMVVYSTGDRGCFPSMAHDQFDAVRHPSRKLLAVKGAGHYFEGPAQLLTDAVNEMVTWARAV